MMENRARAGFTGGRARLLAVGVALFAVGLSACSATEDVSQDSGAPTKQAAGASPKNGPGVGGAPVTVGFANMDSGSVSFPAAHQGAKAAQDYINQKLGGIHGHPLQLEFCDLQNSQQATQACGQKFASDPDIPFAIETINVFGNTPMSSAMEAAGKPVLGRVGITDADLKAPNGYWLYGGNPTPYAANGDIVKAAAQSEGIDHLSVIHNDGDQSTLNGLKIVQQHLGNSTTMVTAAVGPTAGDYLAAISSAQVTSNSALELAIITPSACPAIAKGMAQLGIKPKLVIASTSCITPEILKQNPNLYDGWYFQNLMEEPFEGTTPSPDVQEFIDAWDKYIKPGQPDHHAEDGWAAVMATYNILKSAKFTKLTPDVVKQAVLSYKGPVPMSPGKLACPGAAPYPAVCNNSVVYYQSKNGVLSLAKPAGAP